MLSFGLGHGFSPCESFHSVGCFMHPYFVIVLLVLIVPHLVPLKYVSTALGAHKSVGWIILYRPVVASDMISL